MNTNLNQPVAKKDLLNAIEVILEGVGNLLKGYVTKEDVQHLATKKDSQEIRDEQQKMNVTLLTVQHDITDLKADLPADIEVQTLKKRITRLEKVQNIS